MAAEYPVFNVFRDGVNRKTKEIGFAANRIAAEDLVQKKVGNNSWMILEDMPAGINKGYGFAWFKYIDRK